MFFKKILTLSITVVCLTASFSLTALASNGNSSMGLGTQAVVLDVSYEKLYDLVDELNYSLANSLNQVEYIDLLFRPGTIATFSAPTPWQGQLYRSSVNFNLHSTGPGYMVHTFVFDDATRQVVPSTLFRFDLMQEDPWGSRVRFGNLTSGDIFYIHGQPSNLFLGNPRNASGYYQLVVFRPL